LKRLTKIVSRVTVGTKRFKYLSKIQPEIRRMFF
jgi:hypothetical protein